MSLYEIKEMVRTMVELCCVVFAAMFGCACALLLAFHLFGVVVGR